MLKVNWIGSKATMEGRFVDANGNEVGIGAYNKGNYDVLLSDGNVVTYRNAIQALSRINNDYRTPEKC